MFSLYVDTTSQEKRTNTLNQLQYSQKSIYLQKTLTADWITLKFCVLSNEAVPRKKLENDNFIRAAVLGANISQIFSPPFSSEKKNCEIFGALPWVFKSAIQLVPKHTIGNIRCKLSEDDA